MSNRAKSFLLIIVDLFILAFSLALILTIRNKGAMTYHYIEGHFLLFNFIFPLWIFIYFIEGLYTLKTYNPANLTISLMRGTIFATIASFVFIYLFQEERGDITPKTNLVLVALLSFTLTLLWRNYFFRYFSKDTRLRQTHLIGSSETLELVTNEIRNKPHLGYKISSVHDINQSLDIVIQPDISLVAIERSMTKDHSLYQKIFSLLGSGVEVTDLAKFAEQISGKIPIKSIDESWFIEYCGHQESKSYDVLKRIIDLSTALILLLLLVPLALVLFPILLIFHGRPLFFTQIRTGLNNIPFKIYKLRTMVVNAEKNGAQWARPQDARVTRIGLLLRKTRLDELPQLINIIRGEMSLVGPRPERPEIIEKQLSPYIPFYNLRHLVKPGVTGWAQVTFRYAFTQEDSKEKLQYDLYYVKNRSFWLDIIVIMKTIKTVLTGAGQ